MLRRTFIAGLGSAAARPVVSRAQQPAVPVVGSPASGLMPANLTTLPTFQFGCG